MGEGRSADPLLTNIVTSSHALLSEVWRHEWATERATNEPEVGRSKPRVLDPHPMLVDTAANMVKPESKLAEPNLELIGPTRVWSGLKVVEDDPEHRSR